MTCLGGEATQRMELELSVEGFHYPYMMFRADGSPLWLEESGKPEFLPVIRSASGWDVEPQSYRIS